MEFITIFDIPGLSLNDLWDNVGWLIFFVAPLVMIVFAINAAEHLVGVLRKAIGIDKDRDDPWDD